MLFAANTPVSDATWLPAVLVLIFAVPTGAFLSLFAALTSFLFGSSRESIPVAVLDFLAFGINGSAALMLFDSPYNGIRFVIIPITAFVVAVGAAGVTIARVLRFMRLENQTRLYSMEDAPSPFTDDR